MTLPPDQDPAETLRRLAVEQPDQLLALLNAPDDLAQAACAALGQARHKRHSGVLLAVLRGTRPALWMVSAVALTLLESKRPTRRLLEMVLDETLPAEQHYAATYALGFTSAALTDPRYGEAIAGAFMRLLGNPVATPRVRGVAAEGLGNLLGACFGTRTLPTQATTRARQCLEASLRDPEPEVRFWSAFALGAFGDRAALPALRSVANQDEGRFGNWWTVGEEASDAIDRIEGREPPDRMLRHD